MLHYSEFRNRSDIDFFESSSLCSQEAHLFSMHWQSEVFWRALGDHLAFEFHNSHQAHSERSSFSIARDRHLQGLLDYLPHANPQHQALLLNQSLRTLRDNGLLDDLGDPFSFPLPRLLSDLGAGGISTMLEWAIALRSHGCEVVSDQGISIEGNALWLACELVNEPHQIISNENADTVQHAAWLLLQYCLSRTHCGKDIDQGTQALLTIAGHSKVKDFPGWPLIHILGNLSTFQGLVDLTPHSERHPFSKPELNVGSLVWDMTTPDLVSDGAWQALLASEMRNKTHFASQASRKNSGNAGKKIEAVIRRFIAQEPEAFYEVELNAKGFKNLESLGMRREVLIKHPRASAEYGEVLFGRDLGL